MTFKNSFHFFNLIAALGKMVHKTTLLCSIAADLKARSHAQRIVSVVKVRRAACEDNAEEVSASCINRPQPPIASGKSLVRVYPIFFIYNSFYRCQ
jgi:hypothetical protein